MRTITDLPDKFDPVVLIEDYVTRCPICGARRDWDWYSGADYEMMDAAGIHHNFIKSLNKYKWKRLKDLKCKNCGCHWDTGWYPADHEMFEIAINSDVRSNYEKTLKAFEKIMEKLKL